MNNIYIINEENQEPQKINIDLENKEQTKEMIEGYSTAKVYQTKIENQKYFIKVLKGPIKQKSIFKIKEICTIYQTLNINSLKFLGYGELKDNQEHLYIYNCLEGKNLKQIGETLSSTENYELGYQIGTIMKQLKEYPSEKINNIPIEDIEKFNNQILEMYREILKNENVKLSITKYFSQQKLNNYVEKIQFSSTYLKRISKNLIHGDIKRSNIMKKDEKLYIVDIESMKYSYDIMSLRYQITWLFQPENRKEKKFIQGYFDGLYENQRPNNFNQQIFYILMINFIEHTYKSIKRNQIKELEEYFTEVKRILAQLETSKESLL